MEKDNFDVDVKSSTEDEEKEVKSADCQMSSPTCSTSSPPLENGGMLLDAIPPKSKVPPPPPLRRKLHHSLKNTSSSSSSPFFAQKAKRSRRSLRRVSESVVQKRKVTWTRERKRKSSFSSGSNTEDVAAMLKMYPYHFSITGSAIPHRHQIDTPTTLCLHLVKLVILVTGFTATIFLVHCLMYFLYSVLYDVVTNSSAASRNNLYLPHPTDIDQDLQLHSPLNALSQRGRRFSRHIPLG